MNPDIPDLIVHNATRAFGVRLVRQGDRYGLDDGLTHKETDLLVEFYDRTYASRGGFGPRGQFVARYYARTLRDGSGGLCLYGSADPTWSLPSSAMAEVRSLLRTL